MSNRTSRPTKHPYYGAGGLVDKRLVLVTDLGILMKRSIDGQDVFVQSIATGLPVGDANVEIIAKNAPPCSRSRPMRRAEHNF